MLTKRVIACLDVRGGRVVKGVQFVDIVDAGDPAELAHRHAAAGADEVVLLAKKPKRLPPVVIGLYHLKLRGSLILIVGSMTSY